MLFVRESGSGKPVILLHGFGLNGEIWAQQREALARHYHVIVPDLPGHGQTPPLPDGQDATMSRVAVEVLQVMDRLDLDRAAIAGHSMGGYVALALHKLAPHRVAGLALVTTQARPDTEEGRAGRYALAEKVVAGGQQVLVDATLPKLFAEGFPAESPTYRAVADMSLQMPVSGIQAGLHGMAQREDMRERLHSVKVPALVVLAEGDRLIPPERSEEMASGMISAALVRVPGAGHMVTMEQPQAVTAALEGWLSRVYPE